tara:strand:+ start:195 stop:647 length:453 start_codon:yes stop_codon:yes gene_type:complete
MELSKELIQEQLKKSLKEGSKLRVTTIRSIVSAIINAEKQGSDSSIDSNKIISLIESLIKQRKQAIELYQSSQRPDLAEKEQEEANILKEFLPEPLTEKEITHLIEQTMTSVNATGVKDMGKVMAKLKPLIQGKADMSEVSKEIKQRLSA